MKHALPRILLSVASLTVVLAFVLWESRERTSPGPLSQVHASVEGLADARACDRCHGALASDLAAACAECHGEIGAQVAADAAGFHASLGEGVAACGKCHGEHRGPDAPPLDERSFTLAGYAARADYDHRGLGLELTGRHRELACDACHEHADELVLPQGTKRFLGLADTCASCHDDPHQGAFARDCAECHGQTRPFAEVASFVHTAAFPLSGAHAIEDCRTCHASGTTHSLEASAGPPPSPAARGCADCHADPHRGEFAGKAASLAGTVVAAESCSLCHQPVRGGFAAQTSMRRELHAASGFALARPHAALDCASCHGSERNDAAPVRRADDCAACHTDPHGGQFAGANECRTCHEAEAFVPAAFGLREHARTDFPLENAHARAECAACHPREDEPRRFAATPRACAACHEDPHAVGFAAKAQDCGVCHGTESFRPATAAFDHGTDAGFALRGAHATLECATCHRRPIEGPTTTRTLGLLAPVLGTSGAEACAGCHDDVHRRTFDALLAADFAGREGCARCHDEAAFAEPIAGAFDHGRHAELVLDGAHERAECRVCHGAAPPELPSRRFGFARERFPALPLRPSGTFLDHCDACHDDPHHGTFERAELPRETANGRTGCARCHGTESFADDVQRATFDHDVWTHFPLVGGHDGVACADCHAQGTDAGLGRAPGRRCADCHDDPHAGQFGARLCESCHASPQSFADLAFDHDRHARFTLDAVHETVACGGCHKPAPLAGGGSAIRYSPLGIACSDCHGPAPLTPLPGAAR